MTIPLRRLSSEKGGNMTDAAAGSANGSAIYWEEGGQGGLSDTQPFTG